MLEFWQQSRERKETVHHDDSWSNPYNVNLMREEVMYPDAEYSPTQKLMHNEVVDRVNNLITTKQHNRLFAIVHIASRQYKISEDDLLSIPCTFHAEFGERIIFQKVVCVGCQDFSLVGRPMLDRNLVRVHATVVEKTQEAARAYFYWLRKMKRRTWQYFRDAETVLRINHIQFTRLLNEEKPFDLMPQPAELTTSFATDSGELSNYEMPDRPFFPLQRQKRRKSVNVNTYGIPGIAPGQKLRAKKDRRPFQVQGWRPKQFTC